MAQADLEYVTEIARVRALLHPLRLQILELAIDSTSATEVARHTGLSRQVIHYHLVALESAGFLVPAGSVRRRNMMERRVTSSARSYLIGPEVLGAVGAHRRRAGDPGTPAALQALAARMQADAARAPAAPPSDPSPPFLTLSTKLRFADAEQHRQFSALLGTAVREALKAVPQSSAQPGSGQAFGLVLSLYPLPSSESSNPESAQP